MGLYARLLLRRPAEKALCIQFNEIPPRVAYTEVNSIRPIPKVAHHLEKEGFTILDDGRCKNPYCTIEVHSAHSLKGRADRAEHEFTEDSSLPEYLRSNLLDYRGSGYNRGHMVPAANCRKNVQIMRESFLMSNICPQEPNFNRYYWASFERHVRDLTKQYKSVTVLIEPLYLPQGEPGERYVYYRVIGKNDVAVPTHFFKVLKLEHEMGSHDVIAYIMPNEPIDPETPLQTFQVALEKVEAFQGLSSGNYLAPRLFKVSSN